MAGIPLAPDTGPVPYAVSDIGRTTKPQNSRSADGVQAPAERMLCLRPIDLGMSVDFAPLKAKVLSVSLSVDVTGQGWERLRREKPNSSPDAHAAKDRAMDWNREYEQNNNAGHSQDTRPHQLLPSTSWCHRQADP